MDQSTAWTVKHSKQITSLINPILDLSFASEKSAEINLIWIGNWMQGSLPALSHLLGWFGYQNEISTTQVILSSVGQKLVSWFN